MKRPASKIVTVAVAAAVLLIVLAAVRAATRHDPAAATGGAESPCSGGFHRRGARCCASDHAMSALGDGMCFVGPASACPAPLVATPRGCDTPERSVVRVPKTTVVIGPSDWEAEGRVKPRVVTAGPLDLDRFEVTVGHMRCAGCPEEPAGRLAAADLARAASLVTLDEARAVCKARGGRLPTEDEWIVAAAGSKPSRYPWGDTGAVCRRAAWGLLRGPCATGATGPDTAGAHPDGASPLGIHDLAGNVEEWVESDEKCDGGAPCFGVVRGGSYGAVLATELRTWVRRRVPAGARESGIGFRCAYDASALE